MNFKILKQLRKDNGYKLTDLSQKTGYTASFLSQIERGLKQPSLEALRKISESYDIPMATLFLEDEIAISNPEENLVNDNLFTVIHKKNRKKYDLNGLSSFELLTPPILNSQFKPDITGVYTEINPGCWSSEKKVSHNYDESIYVIKGEMQSHVGNEVYTLEEGDSLYIRRNSFHNLFNSGSNILICIAYFSIN